MIAEEELAVLRAANAALRAENRALHAENEELFTRLSALQGQVAQLTTALEQAQQQIKELAGKKTPPPAFVKANTPARPKQVRKKRAPEHNHARRLETPTQVVEHRLTCCLT